MERGVVNALLRSVLNISGWPRRAMAAFSASVQKSVAIVFDNRQNSRGRLAKPMIVTRSRTPRRSLPVTGGYITGG
jgi:hypothetical protein